jgi:hypothetical protein
MILTIIYILNFTYELQSSQRCLWRVLSSRIYHVVVRWKLTDVSDECGLQGQGCKSNSSKNPAWTRQEAEVTSSSGTLVDFQLTTCDGLRVGRLGPISGRGKVFFSIPQHPDRLWDSLSLLSNGYRELIPWRWSGRCLKLTTHYHLVLRSWMVELYLHPSTCPVT